MELDQRDRELEEVRMGMRGAMAAQLAAAQAAHQEELGKLVRRQSSSARLLQSES